MLSVLHPQMQQKSVNSGKAGRLLNQANEEEIGWEARFATFLSHVTSDMAVWLPQKKPKAL